MTAPAHLDKAHYSTELSRETQAHTLVLESALAATPMIHARMASTTASRLAAAPRVQCLVHETDVDESGYLAHWDWHGFVDRKEGAFVGVNIVFVGTPAWSSQLAEGIATYTDASATAVPITTGKELLRPSAWRDVRGADIVVRVGVRPAADTVRGRAFDTLLGAARAGTASRTACFWTGTDVSNTLAQAARGDGMQRFDDMASGMTHVAVSEWLRDELADVGIEAELAWIPAQHIWRNENLPTFPDTFTVLSYVPGGRYEFYGGPAVIEVARRLPDIQLRSGPGARPGQAMSRATLLSWEGFRTWRRATRRVRVS